MSESRHGPTGNDPEKQRLDHELRLGLSRRFLRHNSALLEDAITRQTISAEEARNKNLRFVDVYTQETAIDTPIDRAIAVLLTRDGVQLHPSEQKPHFFVYYPYMERSSRDNSQMPESIINWVEYIDINGKNTLYTITEDGIQYSQLPDDEGNFEEVPNTNAMLTHAESRLLLDELRSYRLAPLDHYPMSA
jgi:hypothetical protein